MSKTQKKLGNIDVNVTSDSWHFKQNVPIQIRDSKMRLIKDYRQPGVHKVKPGLYQVSAVLEDGQEHKHLVKVRSGGTAQVNFSAELDEQAINSSSQESSYRVGKSYSPRYTKSMAKRALEKSKEEKLKFDVPDFTELVKPSGTKRRSGGRRRPSVDREFGHAGSDSLRESAHELMESGDSDFDSVDIDAGMGAIDGEIEEIEEQILEQVTTEQAETSDDLLALTGAHRLDGQQNPWMLKSDDSIEEVPCATMNVGGEKWLLSLPSSPHDSEEFNSCVVTIDQHFSGLKATAWISPGRTVANAMQNMLASSELLSARELAGTATDLLRSKYQDPTGATLGALVLHKFGLLEEKLSWLNNLARDFSWIPDTKILLASEMVRGAEATPGSRKKAFRLAMQASEQRILFSECHSILLDLLRRSFKGIDDEARRSAVKKLGMQSLYIDWDSICLSHKLQE